MKPIRAVFIETDPKIAELNKPKYADFLSTCGYEVQWFDAKGQGDAQKLIESADAHLVICDLGWSEDYKGMHTIRALRLEYPDVYIIGTSRSGVSTQLMELRHPTFHLFIDKTELFSRSERYYNIIRSGFLNSFRQETRVKITNIDNLAGEEFRKPGSKRELLALIRQIMFSGHDTDLLMHPDEIVLEGMSGGYSGSQVFKMTSRNSRSGMVCVPSVLKVSDIAYAEQENDNYHRFVKWGVPYTWRVDLLGYGTTKTKGAIAYSFILSDLKKFESLTEILRRKEDHRVLTVIDTLFSPELRRWYGDPLIQTEENINERYYNRYFRGGESRARSEQVFREIAHLSFGARDLGNSLEIAGHKFPPPSPTLFGEVGGKYQSCICHGDLNSNNVVVAENNQAIFIDFQETGRGHVFEDFVTMEASIRISHGDDSLSGLDLLKAEMDIRAGDDPTGLRGAQKLIAQIRRLARKNFTSENFKTYYYASAMFNFRLLRLSNLTQRQGERLVAAILAGLAELSRK